MNENDDSILDNWPKHPNGRAMKLGEMNPELRRKIMRAAMTRLAKEFSHPDMQAKLTAILRGENVNQ